MSQFDHPVGSFEYRLHEELATEGISKVIGPLGAEAVVQIAARTHKDVFEKERDRVLTEADAAAVERLSGIYSDIEELRDEARAEISKSVEALTFAYAEAVTTMKRALDVFVDEVDKRIEEVA